MDTSSLLKSPDVSPTTSRSRSRLNTVMGRVGWERRGGERGEHVLVIMNGGAVVRRIATLCYDHAGM